MLAGRDALLATVLPVLADERPIALIGEAGVGKTSLVRALIGTVEGPVFEGGALATLSWMEHLCLRRALGRPPAGADLPALTTDVQRAVGTGLLVLEDLQWAQQDTLDVIGRLADRVRLLVTVRTGDPGTGAALKALADVGVEVFEVPPLDEVAARELVRAVHPGIGAAAERIVLRRSGGNPLLLGELAGHDEPPASLLLSVGARVRAMDPESRRAFGLVALAGRPVRWLTLGTHQVERLQADGLIEVIGENVQVRHALLAEAAIELMDDAERRDAHADLARTMDDPGESARHHALAGETDLAIRKALGAAAAETNEVERAGHLALAARLSTGPDADQLRLDAARALDRVHDWAASREVLDAIEGDDVEVRAWALLLRARMAWAGGEPERMRDAVEQGLALTAGESSEVAVRLRIERTRIPVFIEYDTETGIRYATEAYQLAQRTGVGLPRAEYYLGTALSVGDDPAGAAHLATAIEDSRAEGDWETELASALNLISFHESVGDPAVGRELSTRMIARAEELGLGTWAASYRVCMAGLQYHAGQVVEAIRTCRLVEGSPVDPRTRDTVVEMELLSLIDLGRTDEAERRAEARMPEAVNDYHGQTTLMWIRAEAALWGGHPRRALTLLEQYMDGPEGDPNLGFGLTTRAWARWEAGLPPVAAAGPQGRPLMDGLPAETEGVRLLAEGEPRSAAEHFATAAVLWAPYHRRGDFRCRWAQGEALRRAGERDTAIAVLEQVEADATELGHRMIVGRIHRSLRQLGVRRTAERAAVDGDLLSGREREVLELAGQGLTNAQIGARLGISRRTVVSLVETASAKLGATSRAHAVTLAGGR